MVVEFLQQNVHHTNWDIVHMVTEPTLGGEGQGDGGEHVFEDLLIFHICESFNTA